MGASRVGAADVVVSLGYLEPGASKGFVVEVVNPSDKVIEVDYVVSECRCLRFPVEPAELRPGVNELAMVFEDDSGEAGGAGANNGYYSKRVTLELADSGITGVTKLVIAVTASVGIPLEVRGGDGPGGEIQIRDVTRLPSVMVVNHSGEEVCINYSTSTLPGILASMPRDNIVPAGGTLSVPLKYISEDATAGPARGATITGTVWLHTDHERQQTVGVPVAWIGEAP